MQEDLRKPDFAIIRDLKLKVLTQARFYQLCRNLQKLKA